MTGVRSARKVRGLPDDVEMLQTDIMRFLAIICMCLMILFALVQSLPLTGDNVRPRLQSEALYRQHLQAMRMAVEHLQDELAGITAEIAQRERYLERLRQSAETRAQELEKIKAASERMAHITGQARQRTADAELRLQRVEQRLHTAEAQLAQRMESLAVIEDTLRSAQTRLDEARIEVSEARELLQPMPEEPTAVAQQPPKPEPAPVAAPQEPPPVEEEGFSLSFANEEALRSLIARSGQVSLYLISGGRSWCLQTEAGAWVFKPEAAPGSLYEMEISSVPYGITAAARKVFGAAGRSGAFYGVSLPEAMNAEIRTLMNSRQGGSIVIGPAGEVHIQ